MNLRTELKQLSLDHLYRILDVVDEVRREIGDPCVTMDDVINMYAAEEAAEIEGWRNAPLVS